MHRYTHNSREETIHVIIVEYGLYIPIELFSNARTVQEIIDNVVDICSLPSGEILYTDKYVIRQLTDIAKVEGNGDKIVQILAESFIEKEPLDVLLGCH